MSYFLCNYNKKDFQAWERINKCTTLQHKQNSYSCLLIIQPNLMRKLLFYEVAILYECLCDSVHLTISGA